VDIQRAWKFIRDNMKNLAQGSTVFLPVKAADDMVRRGALRIIRSNEIGKMEKFMDVI
jgi:hypothetical protein